MNALPLQFLMMLFAGWVNRRQQDVKEYTEHYHFERNHQGIDNKLIDDQRSMTSMSGDIERCERLGGVLDYYRRAA